MKIHVIVFITILSLFKAEGLFAQKWAVYFTDKNNSTYSIDDPEKFLSQRAIERRTKYNIEVSEADIPVNDSYIDQLRGLGATVLGTSRWFNFALVSIDQEGKDLIEKLDFVDRIVYVCPENPEAKTRSSAIDKWKNVALNSLRNVDYGQSMSKYGTAEAQISQLNGIPLHNRGLTGSGVLISIIDVGFKDADKIGAFQHIRDRNGIVFERDIINPGGNIFNEHLHGTQVMSCMGGKIEGSFLGTAPDANYALIRTESDDFEYLIEEYTLVIGIELADSLGSDIVNISLGYSHFDDNSMNHDYATEMDGRTTVSSLAAYMAIQRGIFICVAVGNSNYSPWPWVDTPGDVPEVMTVGAVDFTGQISFFSSIGPNSAGYPKPDIVATGERASAVGLENEVEPVSGTSFASPIVCGLVACLIQAYPQIPPKELKEMIIKTGDKYNRHSNDYGYGIPDFDKVYSDYTGIPFIKNPSETRAYPNPIMDNLHIETKTKMSKIIIYDISGRAYRQINCDSNSTIVNMSSYNKGIWFINIEFSSGAKEMVKVVKR